jgi:flagellar biosynthetic protein FliR
VIDLPPITRLAVLLIRPGFLFLSAPVFGGAYAPPILKVGLTTIIAVSLIPIVPLPETIGSIGLTVVVLREALIGLTLGFAIRVLVAGAEFAGHLAGFQLGFAYASVVDPQSGVRNGILSALYGTFAIVVFFGINAHHDLLRALVRSFEMLPIGAGLTGDGLNTTVMQMLGLVFVTGAQLAAPVVIVLLVTELALGLLARTAPTLNLLAQGFPVRLLVGLLAIAAMVQVIPEVVARAVPRAVEVGVRAASLFR